MCNLHWSYTFYTGVALFALVLHLNRTALSQSERSNFFMYIIKCLMTHTGTHRLAEMLLALYMRLVQFLLLFG